LIILKLFGFGVGVLLSNCSSYLLETFSPKELYLIALGISMFTAMISMSFYSILEKLRKLSKKNKKYKAVGPSESITKEDVTSSQPNVYETPQKNVVQEESKLEEEKQFLLPDSNAKGENEKNNKSKEISFSRLLGETQYIGELLEYKTKLASDFQDILYMLKDPRLKLLLLVVTLENITPEISCIFFYYFIEILKFSYFDVNSVFVFASVGFLISLTILNFEFINSSFENFYKVTSFLLAIAYYLNLR
jgi:hypothetical protein